MMKPWRLRAFDEANLYNPAFCGFLLRTCVEQYRKESGADMPYALAFLALPLLLHTPTRRALPRSVATGLLIWLQGHADVRLEFPDRAADFVPYTKEAIALAIAGDLLELVPGGRLGLPGKRPPAASKMGVLTAEVMECIDKAKFLGKWFARSGTESTIFTYLGVTP
jgi:hypothetical protein